MSIFTFISKKEKSAIVAKSANTSCGCCEQQKNQNLKQARFIVLGDCCQKSADTFANVKTAVLELGLSEEVINVGDAVEIAKFGVMQTPALVIDGKVVSYGKLIKTEQAKKLIEQSIKI